MWEYQIKPERPVNPRERSDIHPIKKSMDVAVQHQVNPHDQGDPSPNSPTNQVQHQARVLNCPVCQQAMNRVLLGKIEIDKCPQCQGVFLDRGELETLSQHSLSSYMATDQQTQTNRERTQKDYLIYTPHGLTNHVMEHD